MIKGALTILVPTLPDRKYFLERLEATLAYQILDNNAFVRLHTNNDTSIDIGTKRNKMMAEVASEYMAFFDDDDMPGPNYIKHLMEGIGKGVDCCSLTGIITTDGENPKKFIH
jgi:cellulose synthase/poly-beta-1,6-N-acetylglucosamine synthase-like glycosyltransferase